MKFALYILVAFVFAFAAALPQDVSENQHVSSGMDRLGVSKIEELLNQAYPNKTLCSNIVSEKVINEALSSGHQQNKIWKINQSHASNYVQLLYYIVLGIIQILSLICQYKSVT